MEHPREISEQRDRKLVRKPRSDFHKLAFEAICLACTGIILSLTSYSFVASILGHVDVVGATLVNVQIPSQGVVSVKPISILMAAALGLTYSGLELARPITIKFSHSTFSYLKMLIFVGTALAAYEVFYNFAIWIAQLSTASLAGLLNPDVLVNSFPNPLTPWNLVFATKLTTTLVAAGLYAFYYFRGLEKEKASMV